MVSFAGLKTVMQLKDLLGGVKDKSLVFADVLSFIDAGYIHQPTAFTNGRSTNTAEQNQGSARVLAFAQLNQLSAADTLHLFAEHYQAVIDDPTGDNHQNIRQFMINGWEGVKFSGSALLPR